MSTPIKLQYKDGTPYPDIDYSTDNAIIFTIARMNPPTPGHLNNIIRPLIEEAFARNVSKVYVFLSKSNTDIENPIECTKKILVLGDYTVIKWGFIYV